LKRTSWFKKVWNGRSKGISTVLGTVFLTLVIFAISTNVFLWTLSRNAEYTLAVKEENQKTADRLNEYVIASGTNYSVLEAEEKVRIKVSLKNAGSLAVQLINIWVFDTTQEKYANEPVDVSLNPGQAMPYSLIVALSASNTSDFVSWFVTARGNTVPLQTEEGVIIAELSQGIGSISMDFPQFRYHIYDAKNNSLGPGKYEFSIPSKEDTVLGAYLTNLDESRNDINLTHHSCIWLAETDSAARDDWSITKVVDNAVVDFDYKILEYGKPTLVFFGPTCPSSLSGITAVNILLYGTIGSKDYGQNIPFISIYVTA